MPNLIFFLRNKNLKWHCYFKSAHVALQKRHVDPKKNNGEPVSFWWKFSANHNLPRSSLSGKSRNFSMFGITIMTWYWLMKLSILPIFFVFYISKLNSSRMTFSVANREIHWTANFTHDSVFLTVNDLVHDKNLSSHDFSLPVWNLLLSQRQELLDN